MNVAVSGWAREMTAPSDGIRALNDMLLKVAHDATEAPLAAGLKIEAVLFVRGGRCLEHRIALPSLPGARERMEMMEVRGEGLDAVLHARAMIASGLYSGVLVLACGGAMDPETGMPGTGEALTASGAWGTGDEAAALQRSAYINHYRLDPEAIAKVAAKNRKNAGDSQDAPPCLQRAEAEAVPPADGACAVLLSGSDGAAGYGTVWVTGAGASSGPSFAVSEKPHLLSTAARAASQAYAMAEIEDPPADLGLLEVDIAYAHQELMLYEALRLAPEGGAVKLLESGETSRGGAHPVNLSGGPFGGAPPAASSLMRLADAAAQLSRPAGGGPPAALKKALVASGRGQVFRAATCVIVESPVGTGGVER